MVRELFRYYSAHASEMPEEFLLIGYRDGMDRAVSDFLSCMTESQIVAAISSFAAYMGLYLIGTLATAIDNPIVRGIMSFISLFTRYSNFALGLFALDDIVYYISVTVIFLFLTTRVIEKKRWA